ncbi:DNA polymerase III subunit epsilon [Candidatus Williamhamiltonella defendens]|uniref:DNA polymerase III subunit epsilon n=1 Tax=Candidatus Williamhamiltonella defendens TaxID=138072 RepID=A0AAC9YGH7_9ENTR|nr:DNA polymerase III subunit epsilon [Candidatus Hamiltonella defensa]ASV34362.1 DNA polymerase III subunit epsilon [Candidatus Hamiltonella defensa]AWK17318.1 DNA polymerase III subunit epsilon [Candidatus Hamiltonella defensa]
MTRQIVLDTETTGLNKTGPHYEGHNIIEIGAVEVINRRLTGKTFHTYVRPNRQVDPEAYQIHGISDEFLSDKPRFSEIFSQFFEFIRGSELIIHNAAFDIGFMDYEFSALQQNIPKTNTFCTVTDTLALARRLFPGKRNSLDALCDRYQIDNSKRTLHGALLDAQILAEVYLAMTGGQTLFSFSDETDETDIRNMTVRPNRVKTSSQLKIIYASCDELDEHQASLDLLEKKEGSCIWRSAT